MPDIFVSPKSNPLPNPPLQEQSGRFIKSKLKKDHSLTHQILSSYLFMPEGMHFETQESGEIIILFLRKHWITNLNWIITSLFLIIIPLVLFPSLAISGIISINTSYPIMTFIVLVWYLLVFSYIYVNFLMWYINVSIISSERVIDIDFANLLNKKFAETRISKVEDVTARTGGFIKSLFDYGDVFLQTAAKEAVFQFMEVPRPDEVVKIVNQMMDKNEEGGGTHK